MSSRFSRAMKRVDRAISCRLNDHTGIYLASSGHRIAGLDLMMDRSIELAGALEIFPAGQIVITALKEQLAGARVQRGDSFEVAGDKHIVQEPVKDDGAFVSFLCLEGA